MVSTVRIVWFLPFVVIASFGCGGSDLPPASITASADDATEGEEPGSEGPVRLTAEEATSSSPAHRVDPHPLVLIKTSMGDIQVRLDAGKSPLTVDNFLTNYVDRGFYKDTVIHHVEPGVMVAAGGYTDDLRAKETRAEIRSEANNGLSNRRGTIAMARHPDFAHSATSQFFVNLADNAFLDYQEKEDGEPNGYCVFGEVIDGMEVIDAIAAVETTERGEFPSAPTTPIVILSIERNE